MKIALATWNGRISPLFDSAQRALVVEVEAGQVVGSHEKTFGPVAPAERVSRLAALGVGALVCGAISRPVAAMVEAAGMDLRAWTSGPVEEVLQAFLKGRIGRATFRMPGCRGHGRRFRGGCPRGPQPRGPGDGGQRS